MSSLIYDVNKSQKTDCSDYMVFKTNFKKDVCEIGWREKEKTNEKHDFRLDFSAEKRL
jgi:hypothetical protein